MSETQGMTEAELAEYYDRSHDFSEFDQSGSFPVEVTRDVTISVRFSAEEIQALRREAEAAGVKVTAYIRAGALQASSPVDRRRLQEALRAVSEDVAQVQRLLTGKT
jgi:hypothetical protein